MSQKKREPKQLAVKAKPIPALFATIHFKTDKRPGGYTPDEIAELNELANRSKRDD